jgi:hypothetical protein
VGAFKSMVGVGGGKGVPVGAGMIVISATTSPEVARGMNNSISTQVMINPDTAMTITPTNTRGFSTDEKSNLMVDFYFVFWGGTMG